MWLVFSLGRHISRISYDKNELPSEKGKYFSLHIVMIRRDQHVCLISPTNNQFCWLVNRVSTDQREPIRFNTQTPWLVVWLVTKPIAADKV